MDYMAEAARLACEGVERGYGGPFGAVIVRQDTIIAGSCNRVLKKHDPTAHAEMEAIRSACDILGTFSLAGSVMYATCEPCPMCLAAIHWARLDKVVYAMTRADAAAAGFDDAALYKAMRSPTVAMEKVKSDGAREAFRIWRTKPDRIQY